ncbi:pectinesterase inhibitor-like [Dorcoceras hygrometricum]|uniref:Pectinesterase inhibitor-like n=1 Tax=Dorcoceras hygrometricum TaxID=472368 RepID=A0A2Z7C1L3_9LAMI|nr:pectinesterase inhibitor-like [Dorcoceras hygrometricum]
MVFYSPKNCPIIFFSLSLILLINTNTSVQTSDNDLVHEICPKTRNPTFCFQILGRLTNGSLPELCQAAVRPTRLLAQLAADEARELLIQGQYPAMNERFKSCIGSYRQTDTNLSAVLRVLNAGQYQSLPAEASAAFAEAGACDRQFKRPASEPAQLKKGTKDLEDGCSIVLLISRLLARR